MIKTPKGGGPQNRFVQQQLMLNTGTNTTQKTKRVVSFCNDGKLF